MRFFCEKSRMFSKAKGFVFKGLFQVWEKNKFFSYSLVWSMGVKKAGVSSHCTRVSTITWKDIMWVHGQDMTRSFLFLIELWNLDSQMQSRCDFFQPNRQTCEMFAKFWLLLSLSKAHQLRTAPDTTAKQQEAERWGTGFPTSSSRAHPQWCNSSSYFGNCFHFPILICLRLWILKRCQLRFYLLIFLFLFLDLQNPQYLVIFR